MNNEYEFNVIVGVEEPPVTDIYVFAVSIEVAKAEDVPLTTRYRDLIMGIMRPSFLVPPKHSYYMGKTVLSFGNNDEQTVLNWERRPDNTLAVKLFDSMLSEYTTDDVVYISREIQQPITEIIRFIPVESNVKPELRPSIESTQVKRSKVSATLGELVTGISGISNTGSIHLSGSEKTYVTNQVLERYYNKKLQSADVNIDFSDFSNFVTFGSAAKRIEVFRAKLQEIELLIQSAPTHELALGLSGSVEYSGSYNTVFGTLEIDSLGIASLQPLNAVTGNIASSVTAHLNTSISISNTILELIRGFDNYEAELWFDDNKPYSGSNDTVYFASASTMTDYTYPKILGIPYSSTSTLGSNWYNQLSAIGSDYDTDNRNRLQYNLPKFLQEDEDSTSFLLFTDVIGHHFDNVSSFISEIDQIQSRYPKADEEISGEVSRRVLESYGVNVPDISSVENLVRYVTGDNTGSVTYKALTDEYYKRYLHTLPHLLKTKGTKKSIDALLNVFGINPNIITVKESLDNRITTLEPSKVLTSEQDFSLNFNSGSYVIVPFSSSLRSPQTVQLSFATIAPVEQTLLNFGDSYRVDLLRHPSASSNTYYTNYGRVDLVSGSTTILTSNYFDLFDEQYTALQLGYNAAGVNLYIRKLESGDTTFSQSLQETEMSMSVDWSGIDDLYIGSPPVSSSAGYISASIDEFRIWQEPLSENTFVAFAENPGIYAGESYSSSLYSLYGRLSFNIPTDVATDGSVTNTSPYLTKTTPIDVSTFVASGFNAGTSPLYQTSRHVREVYELSYNIGSNQPTTDMVRIAPDAPTGSLGIIALSSEYPHVNMSRKFMSSSVGTTRLDISISPQDSIDRDIIRAYGNFNLGDYIGDPTYRFSDRYTSLDTIHDTFITNIAPVIDYNKFAKFFDKFLHLFYQIIDDYLPARARVTKGIVIRSNILDRTKIIGRTNIKFSGETSRRTENAITSGDSDIIRSLDLRLDGENTESFGIFGYTDSYNIGLSIYDDLEFVTEVPYYEALISNYTSSLISDTNHFEGDILISGSRNISANALSGYDQTGFDTFDMVVSRFIDFTSSLLTEPTMSAYVPFCDFYDIAAYQYYNTPTGLYYRDRFRYIPVTQSYMSPQPTVTTWVDGNSYQRGDVALQPTGLTDSDGNPYSENNKHFVFTNAGSPANNLVVSTHVPQIDKDNWVPLLYIPEIYQQLVRLAYVNNDISNVSILTNTISSYDSAPQEYDRRHFRFYRENTVGARARTYKGTLNTVDGTLDGGLPFETSELNVNVIQVTDTD